MRFHPRRWFRRPRVREDVAVLAPQNRCLVSLLLFLLALTGTWNVALWLATDADFSYSYFIEAGDSNSSQTNTSTTQNLRLHTIATVISVFAKLSAISSKSPESGQRNVTASFVVQKNGTTVSTPDSPVTKTRNVSVTRLDTALVEQFSRPMTVASVEQLVNTDATLETAIPKRGISSTISNINSDHLLNISNFAFLHTSVTACDGELHIVVVHSAAANCERRQMIRKTWGTHQPVFFMLGRASSESVQAAIDRESNFYGDIVQGSFIDTYRNLTYKHVMALRWTLQHCPSAEYIVKVDDDVLVNINILQKYLNNLRQVDDVSSAERTSHHEPTILCEVVNNAYVKRSYRSKWRLSFREYRSDKYPPYCNGWAVIYSTTAVSQLLNQTARVPFLWVDDVYVTGLLAERAGIKPTQIEDSFIASVEKFDDKLDSSKLESFAEHVALGPPQLELKEMERLWFFVSSHKKRRSDTKSVILSYY